MLLFNLKKRRRGGEGKRNITLEILRPIQNDGVMEYWNQVTERKVAIECLCVLQEHLEH